MTESAALAPGVVVADTYEIERLVGRGGMGEVWLANHRRLAGKQVAIKVLHVQGLLTTEALKRFQREAELAARLEHPNLVQVTDFNTLPSGQPYLVMEFLKGTSLAARLKQGPLSLDAVQQLVRQVGAALQVAHAAGVVHRDLKPENIFLVPTALGDTVKVLDFGISKLADSNSVQTTDSVLIGTPAYMSPEQALGNNKDITAQSDLFSLGTICYELLTGNVPWLSASVATCVFRIAYEAHPPLAQARADLPPHVVAAVEHALVKAVDQRTPDIEAFVAEFTGQRLAPRPGGVYQSGMVLDESVMAGKTAATPQPSAARASAGPLAPTHLPDEVTVSGTKLALGMLAVVGVLFVVVWWLRPWADNYRAALNKYDDGGEGVVLPPPAIEVVADAGPSVFAVAPVVDAGPLEVVVADAGPFDAGIADAGRGHGDHKAAALPAGDADATRLLAELRASSDAGKWEDLVNKRHKVNALPPSKAKVDALRLLILAICHRAEDILITREIDELRALAPAELPALKRACVTLWDGAESRTW